jgi:hypothetical protein
MKKTLTAICSVLVLVGCGSSTDSADTTAVTDTTAASSDSKVKPFEMTLTVGDNTGPTVVIEVAQDAQVVLTFVNPDSNDEIHLHGYDLSTGAMEQGDEAVVSFQANQAGDFEIESHETGELLATLRVNAA